MKFLVLALKCLKLREKGGKKNTSIDFGIDISLTKSFDFNLL